MFSTEITSAATLTENALTNLTYAHGRPTSLNHPKERSCHRLVYAVLLILGSYSRASAISERGGQFAGEETR